MRETLLPRILRPDYTWPCPMQSIIRMTTPPTPRIPGKLERRIRGIIHDILSKISERYCKWLGIDWDPTIRQLPFGLLIKSSERVTVEEFAAMKMVRAAGMPVPLALSCGEHPNDDLYKISILMTRLPGRELRNSRKTLDLDSEGPWLSELKQCVSAMRKWCSPYSSAICSALGTTIRSIRVPRHRMGPFQNEQELHDFLISYASSHSFDSEAEFHSTLVKANEIRKMPQGIAFTHGDFRAHNILIGDDGHLSAFLDWESAGWCPVYWDVTTSMRWGQGSWWYQVTSWMGGEDYTKELACDKALNALTVDSYIC